MPYPNMIAIDAPPILATRLPSDGECGLLPQKAIARRKAISEETELTRKIHVQDFCFVSATRNLSVGGQMRRSSRRSMPLPSGITTLSSYPRARERLKARFNLAGDTFNQAKRTGDMSWNR